MPPPTCALIDRHAAGSGTAHTVLHEGGLGRLAIEPSVKLEDTLLVPPAELVDLCDGHAVTDPRGVTAAAAVASELDLA